MKNKFYTSDYVGFYESMHDFKPIQNKDLSENKMYKNKTEYNESVAYGVADFETQVLTDESREQLKELNQSLFNSDDIDFDLINNCKAEVVCGFFTLWNEEELGNVYLQRDIISFINTLMSLPYRLIYLDFHNLAFDGQFIISGLNQMGFKCIHDDFDFENNEVVKNKVKVGKNVKAENMVDKSYSLSVRKGQWYELSIYWIDEVKIKNKVYQVQRQIRCYDSYKVITTSLENAVKGYTGIITPDKKGWDYSKHYDRNVEFTDKELSYIKFDSLAYLCLMYEVRVVQGITNKTASGFAFGQFRKQTIEELERFFETGETTKDYLMSDECQRKYEFWKQRGNSKRFAYDFFNNTLMQEYPINVYNKLFKSYKGGYTAFNKWIYDNAVKENKRFGVTFDYNSLYPSVMSETEKLSQLLGFDVYYPFGSPIRGYGNYKFNEKYQSGEYSCVIAKIEILNFKLKNNHVPTLRATTEDLLKVDTREYLSENIDKNGERFSIITWKTDKEIDDIKERYECRIIIREFYLFRGTKDIFKSFINKHYLAKQTSKGVKRNVSKLILNSTYGKFGTNLLSTIDFPIIENGKIKIDHIKDEFGCSVNDYSTENYNVAIASFITTYARLALFKVVDILLERGFSPVYQDTDSIHLLFKDMKELNGIVDTLTELDVLDFKNSGDRLLLKCEGFFTEGKYLGAKKYVENINKSLLIKDVIELEDIELESKIRENQNMEYYCAGLSTKDLIRHYEAFEICQNPKEIKKMWEDGKLYHEPFQNGAIVNPHLYYDKELKYPVKGAFIRNVKKTVSGGVIIEHNIFIVTPKLVFSF